MLLRDAAHYRAEAVPAVDKPAAHSVVIATGGLGEYIAQPVSAVYQDLEQLAAQLLQLGGGSVVFHRADQQRVHHLPLGFKLLQLLRAELRHGLLRGVLCGHGLNIEVDKELDGVFVYPDITERQAVYNGLQLFGVTVREDIAQQSPERLQLGCEIEHEAAKERHQFGIAGIPEAAGKYPAAVLRDQPGLLWFQLDRFGAGQRHRPTQEGHAALPVEQVDATAEKPDTQFRLHLGENLDIVIPGPDVRLTQGDPVALFRVVDDFPVAVRGVEQLLDDKVAQQRVLEVDRYADGRTRGGRGRSKQQCQQQRGQRAGRAGGGGNRA